LAQVICMRNFSFLSSNRARSSSTQARTKKGSTTQSVKSPQISGLENHRLSVTSTTSSTTTTSNVDTPVNDDKMKNFFLTNGAQVNAAPSTLMIWDWDDTILPSAWCARNRLTLEDPRPVRAEQARHLKKVAAEARKTLLACKSVAGCKVVIITNAEEKWVQLSCAKFMPGLEDVIATIEVVSARTKFESSVGMCPTTWKEMAFRESIENFLEQREDYEIKNFVKLPSCSIFSFGDSQYEREALRITTSDVTCAFSKCVRFFEKPTPDQVCKQHVLVRESLADLLKKESSLDLLVQVDDSTPGK
jgi:hypothetical protein